MDVRNITVMIVFYADENNLPEGTYPIFLSPITQEKMDCVIDWDLSPLEPQKIIAMERIRTDLQTLDKESNFFSLRQQITVNMYLAIS